MKRLSDMPQVPTKLLAQNRCRLFPFSVHSFSSKINVVTVCFLLAQRSNPSLHEIVRWRGRKANWVVIVARTCGVNRRDEAIGDLAAAEPWIASLRSQ
jgi:hypothetical protein